MRLINVKTKRLEEFIGKDVPPYAILSHTWGSDEDEVLFEDIEGGILHKGGATSFSKLDACCKQAAQDGLEYAWIDTCCIPRSNSTELAEAINSMFRWYKNADVCYVYLVDVPIGVDCSDPTSAFFSCRWFTRGWTLQELLAPKEVRFYDSTWNLLGRKAKLYPAIEIITGIPGPILQGWAPIHSVNVAQRMSWAAKRTTKRPEDIAYCLLGIFGVTLPMIFGEGAEEAFSRLQQKIMTEIRDDSILAWGLDAGLEKPKRPANLLSAGVLARSPSEFVNCGRIVSRQRYVGPAHSLEISGGSLSIQLPLHTDANGGIYGVLGCGPDGVLDSVVTIPLHPVSPESVEYIRLDGPGAQIRFKADLDSSIKLIYIQKERATGNELATDRQHWFYFEGSIDNKRELIDVLPKSRWQRDLGMITTIRYSEKLASSYVAQRSLARFRGNMSQCSDIVVVLDFSLSKGKASAECHMMTCSVDTKLEDLAMKLQFVGKQAFGKQSAFDGKSNVTATVVERFVAGLPMFVLRLATTGDLHDTPIDATLELWKVDLMLGLIGALQQEKAAAAEAGAFDGRKHELTADLQKSVDRLAQVRAEIEQLMEEQRILEHRIALANDALDHDSEEHDSMEMRNKELQETKMNNQNLLVDLHGKQLGTYACEGQWVDMIAEMLINSSMVKIDLDDPLDQEQEKSSETKSGVQQGTSQILAGDHREATIELLFAEMTAIMPKDFGGTAFGWSAANGLRSLVRLYLERRETTSQTSAPTESSSKSSRANPPKVIGIESVGESGQTPLSYAAGVGHVDIVKALIAAGAYVDSKDATLRTPLSHAAWADNYDIVNTLIAAGADVNSKDCDSKTPLSYAAGMGNFNIVKNLIHAGANIDSVDTHCRTPLSHAAEGGHIAVVEHLLHKGANPSLADDDGCTPNGWAMKMGHPSIADKTRRGKLDKFVHRGKSSNLLDSVKKKLR